MNRNHLKDNISIDGESIAIKIRNLLEKQNGPFCGTRYHSERCLIIDTGRDAANIMLLGKSTPWHFPTLNASAGFPDIEECHIYKKFISVSDKTELKRLNTILEANEPLPDEYKWCKGCPRIEYVLKELIKNSDIYKIKDIWDGKHEALNAISEYNEKALLRPNKVYARDFRMDGTFVAERISWFPFLIPKRRIREKLERILSARTGNKQDVLISKPLSSLMPHTVPDIPDNLKKAMEELDAELPEYGFRIRAIDGNLIYIDTAIRNAESFYDEMMTRRWLGVYLSQYVRKDLEVILVRKKPPKKLKNGYDVK